MSPPTSRSRWIDPRIRRSRRGAPHGYIGPRLVKSFLYGGTPRGNSPCETFRVGIPGLSRTVRVRAASSWALASLERERALAAWLVGSVFDLVGSARVGCSTGGWSPWARESSTGWTPSPSIPPIESPVLIRDSSTRTSSRGPPGLVSPTRPQRGQGASGGRRGLFCVTLSAPGAALRCCSERLPLDSCPM